MPAFVDMTGQAHNLLTVLGRAHTGSVKVQWLCTCQCGNLTVVDGAKIRSGHTTSCGCQTGTRGPAINRFLDRVQFADGGCVEWTGGLNGVGYGQFFDRRKAYAHRWSYEFFIGPIPDGLHLDHLCRNRRCVNPYHLEPVTIRENLLRGEGTSAANARKTHCPAGHPLAGANLYINPSKNERRCRECSRARSAARYRATARKAS